MVTDPSSFLQSLTTPSLKINLATNHESLFCKNNCRFTQNYSFLQKQIEKENKRFKETSCAGGDMSFEEVSILNLPFIY